MNVAVKKTNKKNMLYVHLCVCEKTKCPLFSDT